MSIIAKLNEVKRLTELDLDIPIGTCELVGDSHARCKICGTPTFIGETQMYALGLCGSCFDSSVETITEETQK